MIEFVKIIEFEHVQLSVDTCSSLSKAVDDVFKYNVSKCRFQRS